MLKIGTKIVLTSLLFLMSFASVKAATHYLLGYSAVDSMEIAWGGSTTYSSQFSSAVSTWNALGKVNITPDTVWTIEDLTVSDVNSSSGAWSGVTGLYTNRSGADRLQLNKYYLGSNTSSQRQNTCTHELGHALGLAHSSSGNIMYYAQSSQTSLGSQDTSDYSYLYP